MQEKWDLVIVGGGASGMIAAITAARLGDRVLLLERAPALGRKIAASGNGRCNLMNTGYPVYYGDTCFVQQVFEHYSNKDLKNFWNDAGLFLTEDECGRVYPRTLQASSVLDALKMQLRIHQVEIVLQTTVSGIRKADDSFFITSSDGLLTSKRVLIAAGGMAYPKLGGTESGYRLLESLGHRIIQPFPALCPLCTDSRSISGLSGIRVRCRLSLYSHSGKKLYSSHGEVLFTDYGISGICAMQCARFISNEDCIIYLDLAENLFPDIKNLTDNLILRRSRFADLTPEYLLNGILVPRLSFAVLKQSGIALRGRTAGDITDEEIYRIAKHLHSYRIEITGTRGFGESQVTAGGADCSEFNPFTMESYIVKNLYAAGEVLNVDGDCGGYNLMFAFITGILAGRNGRKG